MISENFVQFMGSKYQEHWELPVFSNYEEKKGYTYAEMAQWIAKVHLMLQHNQIEKGDKIALIGKDCAEWCMTWMGIVTYGAVVVPILPQFHADDIQHIIAHSESKLVFVGEEHERSLSPEAHPMVTGVFGVKTLNTVEALSTSALAQDTDAEALFAERYPNGFTKADVQYPEVSNEEVVLISYTSGTSGFSKGVMATANNLIANVQFGIDSKLVTRGDKMLCFLPNAHAYSCAFNFLLPQAEGAHVYILGSKPTPHILSKGLKDVKPNLVLSVPLILEKIYKNVLQPKLNDPKIKLALNIPIIRGKVKQRICQSLIDALGGNIQEFIVGGAALNSEVESFLLSIGFPVTVGYGMTECSPIISYSNHRIFKRQSSGHILHKIEEVRIDNPQRIEGKMVGEVQVKGENVCKGYYKNPKATEELFTEDGWMHTGDLGYIEGDCIFLKGRSKAMLLGPDGQNIYPEEIEAKLSMQPFVNDAIVVQRDKKIVAILAIDRDGLSKAGHTTEEQILEVMNHNRKTVNQAIAAFAQINAIELLEGEFEKTPKQSIKRYLYK
ncbi:AMP-binding protein [Porphyromonas levii]|uniref:AMP-binding protein n=1 Tax=Porphyromonas levii TaxID=28114 RepID=UPI001BA71591|nr:AMP-binding protein [Porphyromonas levii]MBR8803030.1 Long-chain-fatty-acid--CoA ligase FadD15 [Porphyromonas levii]